MFVTQTKRNTAVYWVFVHFNPQDRHKNRRNVAGVYNDKRIIVMFCEEGWCFVKWQRETIKYGIKLDVYAGHDSLTHLLM